jgi:two-component system, LytTR family, response regulator
MLKKMFTNVHGDTDTPENTGIVVCTLKGNYLLNPDDIIRLEARSNYTHIYLLNKKKLLISKVLKGFAQQLEPLGFLRTHRTHLVNRLHIQHVDTDGRVIMKDESVAGLSRRQKKRVLNLLKD